MIQANFTSKDGCIDICREKFYFSGFPTVSEMISLSDRLVDSGIGRFAKHDCRKANSFPKLFKSCSFTINY